MSKLLPTGVFPAWTIQAFRDALVGALAEDTYADEMRLYFYAVTLPGWRELQKAATLWMTSKKGRRITAVIGTDHALTQPEALRRMQRDGVNVRLMTTYRGIFHPKVAWLKGTNSQRIWVGSNNLTHDGLANNVEFSAELHAAQVPQELQSWSDAVEEGSEALSNELLSSYERQRTTFETGCLRARAITFVWDRRREPPGKGGLADLRRGELILEIMPQETGSDGRQIQIPMRVVTRYFTLGAAVGSAIKIRLRSLRSNELKELTITRFANKTARLSLHDLDYRDRPCVIVFSQKGREVRYEIVSQSIFPSRYRALLARCTEQTRLGSRRWGIT